MKALLLKTMARCFSWLPAGWLPGFARPLAFLLWHVSGRLRTVSLKNLELCYPEKPRHDHERIARAAMRHYALNALETGMAWYWPRGRFDARFEAPDGLERLQEALDRGHGVLFLAPHYGAWEMLGLRMSDVLGATLYKPGDDAAIERLLVDRRGRFGADLVPAGRRGLKALMASLADGQAVAVLPDQEPKAGDGRFAPFFGVPALTGVLVPRLLQRTGARAVFSVCVRQPGGRFRVHVLEAHPDIYSADLDTAVAAVNEGVERCIALDPDQYLWAYKRFRARPPGEPRLY